jgi:Fe-S-cluster containining protein
MPVDIVELVVTADRLVETAGERFAKAAGAEEAGDAMGWLVRTVEAELNGISSCDEQRLACGPGCSFCCVVNVSVLVPEAVAIALYLRQTVPAGELGRISEKAQRQAEKVRWVEDHERPLLRFPCSFLDERGWCLIHPVRPLMCRSVSSDDSGACQTISSHQETMVVMHLPQKILCSLVFTGLARVLQQHGFDCRSLELNRMVSNILERPVLADDFLARKRIDFL